MQFEKNKKIKIKFNSYKLSFLSSKEYYSDISNLNAI